MVLEQADKHVKQTGDAAPVCNSAVESSRT